MSRINQQHQFNRIQKLFKLARQGHVILFSQITEYDWPLFWDLFERDRTVDFDEFSIGFTRKY